MISWFAIKRKPEGSKNEMCMTTWRIRKRGVFNDMINFSAVKANKYMTGFHF